MSLFDTLEDLAANKEVIAAALDAIRQGVSKETLLVSIKLALKEASDLEMRRELSNGEPKG